MDSSILGRPQYNAEAQAYLVAVPERVRERALALLPDKVHAGVRAGLLALSEKCPHDQTRMPYCESSRWFECPRCGAKFNALGDKTAGPAPASMSLHAVEIGPNKVVSSWRASPSRACPSAPRWATSPPRARTASDTDAFGHAPYLSGLSSGVRGPHGRPAFCTRCR